MSRTCRHAPPSHIYGHYLVIKARVESLLSSRLPLGEEALHTSTRGIYPIMPRHITRNPIIHETPKYPHTSIEQPHTTNRGLRRGAAGFRSERSWPVGGGGTLTCGFELIIVTSGGVGWSVKGSRRGCNPFWCKWHSRGFLCQWHSNGREAGACKSN